MSSFVSYNPSTGEPLGVYPIATEDEVQCALQKARMAAVKWSSSTVAERCALLAKLRDSLVADADEIAEQIMREIGKPAQEAYGADVLAAVQSLNWLVKQAPGLLVRRSAFGKRSAQMIPEPYGVIGIIGTWNYPLALNIMSLAWALVAGNTVVWKPSELATGNALLLQKRLEALDLPVFLITGDGTTGRALCHAGCDKIGFTGGVPTGRAILTELAKQGIPSLMELSGNDAFLVCPDAPLKAAAESAVWGRFCNAGQTCVAPQRVYVTEENYDAFVKEAIAATQKLRLVDDIGPMRTDGLRSRVHSLVTDAVAGGAKLLAGGEFVNDRPGFFYKPTLLTDCSDDMAVVEEDFFGPVLTITAVADMNEAVCRANATKMGLGASVWTKNVAQGREIAERLRAGMVMINDCLRDVADPALPFGGVGASGFGKTGGREGLDEFVRWKVVAPHYAGIPRVHLFPYRKQGTNILRSLISLLGGAGAGKLGEVGSILRSVRELRSAPHDET